jgi:two-component system chemotaxis response regulator CheY
VDWSLAELKINFASRGKSMSSNLQILIVDDYKTMLRILHGLLREIGLSNVDEATNGEAALQLLGTKKYDLILSDWNMEPMSGLELLRAVRSNPRTKHIPFIFITAEAKVENVAVARAAGVSGYMIKPFNAVTLKAKISPFLQLAQ